MSHFSEILTFLARLHLQQGSYTQTALLDDGSRLRFEAVFNPGDALAAIDHSRLGSLKVLPDRLIFTRLDGSQLEESQLDNRACLGRLRNGLGPGVGRMAAALDELSPRRGELLQLIGKLSAIKNDFTLLVLPGIAWFDAVLPAGALPGLIYPDFSGHVMIKNLALDIGGSNKHIGFDLTVLAAQSAGTLVVNADAVSIELDDLKFSIDMTLVVGLAFDAGFSVTRIDSRITRADFVATTARVRFGTVGASPTITGSGSRVTIDTLTFSTVEQQDDSLSPVRTRGRIGLSFPRASLSAGPLDTGNPDTLVTVHAATLLDTTGVVELAEPVPPGPPSTGLRAALTIGRLNLKADMSLRNAVAVSGVEANLSNALVVYSAAGLDIKADVQGKADHLKLFGAQGAVVAVEDVALIAEQLSVTSPTINAGPSVLDAARLSLYVRRGAIEVPGISLADIAGDVGLTTLRSTQNAFDAVVHFNALAAGQIQLSGTAGQQVAQIANGTGALIFGELIVQDRRTRQVSRGEFTATLIGVHAVIPLDISLAGGSPIPVQFELTKPAGAAGAAATLRISNLFSLVTPAGQMVAGDFELRAQMARAQIAQYPLAKSFLLTEQSFEFLSDTANPAIPPLPDSVLLPLKQSLLRKPFASLDDLATAGRDAVNDDILWDQHRIRVLEAASVKRTVVNDAQFKLQSFGASGQLSTTTGLDTILEGELRASSATLAFSSLDDIFLSESVTLVNAHPVPGQDALQIVDLALAVPTNALRRGSLGLCLSFDTAVATTNDVKLEIPAADPGNKFRFVADFRGASGQTITGQIRVPNARMTIDSIGQTVDVRDIQLSINEDRPMIGLAQPFRGLNFERTVRFSFTSKIPTINFGDPETAKLSFASGLIDRLRFILAMVGLPQPPSRFDGIIDALSNPAALLKGVANWITDLTGFGVTDIGLYAERGRITGRVDPVFSNYRSLAFRLTIPLPSLGVYVGYRYRVPKFGLPPWEDKNGEEIVPGILNLSGQSMNIVVKVGFRVDPVTRSIEIDSFDMFVLPQTGDALIDSLLAAAESIALEAFFSVGRIKSAIIAAIRDQFRIPLPDNVEPVLLRLEFDAANNEMTLNLETFERHWNSLAG